MMPGTRIIIEIVFDVGFIFLPFLWLIAYLAYVLMCLCQLLGCSDRSPRGLTLPFSLPGIA
jgi:hypothetical protein